MYGRTRRQILHRPRTRAGGGLPLATMLLVGALILLYGYRHWTAEPLAPVIGRARIADGDSVEIAGNRIRLQGIDAPELHQTCSDSAGQPWPCGRTAADELRRHIAGRELTCLPSGRDRYRRLLAVCSLSDDSDVNAWLVRQGWAVSYSFGGTYQSEQNEAKAARRGIWAGTFMTPSEWRRQHMD
jgi:endonuclease YncB( thermonuclease family)